MLLSHSDLNFIKNIKSFIYFILNILLLSKIAIGKAADNTRNVIKLLQKYNLNQNKNNPTGSHT